MMASMAKQTHIPVTIGAGFPMRRLTLEQALGVATGLHRQGDVERADAAYESIPEAIQSS